MKRPRREPAPRPIDPTCPSWCTADHDLNLDLEDGLRLHGRAITPAVELVALDDLEAGTRTAAEIVVRADSGGTVRWATGLALAILAASDHLDDGAR